MLSWTYPSALLQNTNVWVSSLIIHKNTLWQSDCSRQLIYTIFNIQQKIQFFCLPFCEMGSHGRYLIGSMDRYKLEYCKYHDQKAKKKSTLWRMDTLTIIQVDHQGYKVSVFYNYIVYFGLFVSVNDVVVVERLVIGTLIT